jgi:tetrathionate reductase subunit B
MTAMNTFLVHADKCTGCKLCVIACKDEHVGSEYLPWTRPQPDTGHFWIDVHALERGKIPRVKVTYLPVLCQHCENAPCVTACPEGAIKTRDDGLVWIDPAACTGCGLCQKACPYDVIFMNDDLKIAQKCTGCAHRVDEGAMPRCVDVCPHDAIVFYDATNGASVSLQSRNAEIFHPEYNARPRVRWTGLPRPWIAGSVIDQASDEVLAGVAVTALDLFDSNSVSTRSDSFGDFWLHGLTSGHKYKVECRLDGYAPFVTILTTAADADLGTVALTRRTQPAK